jgi:hypothetical protein
MSKRLPWLMQATFKWSLVYLALFALYSAVTSGSSWWPDVYLLGVAAGACLWIVVVLMYLLAKRRIGLKGFLKALLELLGT